MADTFDYIKVTDKNLASKDAVFDATVVANYGDPGLDEDYHSDILSRFVICKLESCNRTLTFDRYKNMLVVVKRPEALWISYDGGFQNNPGNQRRTDANLNTNIGSSASFTVNAIPRMNNPYRLGDKLKIKFIKGEPMYFLANNNSFFQSQCPFFSEDVPATMYYGDWHKEGLNSNAYIANNNGENNLKLKCLAPAGNGLYYVVVNKTQYEAFALSLFPEKAESLISLFSNSSNFKYYYQANGGYAYSNTFSLNLNFCKFEDMNLDGRARTQITNCMPLIVASPTTFTVPKSRNSGTVSYQPTYIEKD